MFSPKLPAGSQPQAYRPMGVAPQAGAVVLAPTATPVVASGSTGIMATIGSIFTSIINFFKGLFGGKAAATTATPAAVAGDDASVAKQFGLRNDAANVAAFKASLATVQAEPGVLGPGTNSPDAIKQLQAVLDQWGYAVPVTGTFDPATADAVMRFKATNGLTEGFTFDNGDQGVLPFVDNNTRSKMTVLLKNSQAPITGLDHTPGNATALQTPISVASLPPLPPPPALPALTPPSLPPLPSPPVLSTPPLPVLPPLPTPVATPGTTPATPATPASTLTADQQATCQQAGILATADNLAAYTKAIAAAKAQPEAIGPGLTNADEAVRELQQLLAQWGYGVQATGSFDAATTAAVTKFKRDSRLTEAYKLADGSDGVSPYVDARTKDAMVKKLKG